MNKISADKEYFVDPFSNLKIVFQNKLNAAATGDLILVFGQGYSCVDSRTVLSKLIGVMYGI